MPRALGGFVRTSGLLVVLTVSACCAANGCGRVGFERRGGDGLGDLDWPASDAAQAGGEAGAGDAQGGDWGSDPAFGDGVGADGCVDEADAAFCARLAKTCGQVTDLSNCAVLRTVDCGDCLAPAECGGGGIANDCAVRQWTGVHGSEFGPWTTRLVWGSAAAGGVSGTAALSANVDLAVDRADHLALVWQDGAAFAEEVYLRYFDGTAWQELGGSASGGGLSRSSAVYSRRASVAFLGDGRPVVAWQEQATSFSEVYVLQWNGSAWTELGANSASLGGISDNPRTSDDPIVAVDSTGAPRVAWEDASSTNYQVYFRGFAGASWPEEPAGSATGAGISNGPAGQFSDNPDLVLVADVPYVAWSFERSIAGQRDIYLRYLTGGVWTALSGSASTGGISATADYSFNPRLAVRGGEPVVAWEEVVGGNYEIYLRYHTGAAWAELGGSATGNGLSNTPTGTSLNATLAVDGSGVLTAAWTDDVSGRYQIYVRQWNGASWVEAPTGSATGRGVSESDVGATRPRLVALSDDTLVVAWQDNGDQQEIAAKRWRAGWSAWLPFGTSNAAGGALSNSTEASRVPDLVLSPTGALIAVWQENVGAGTEVFLKRETAGGWEELDSSATGSGLSRSGGATSPAVACLPGGELVVVWHQDPTVKPRVFARRLVGASWSEAVPGAAADDGLGSAAEAGGPAVVALDAARVLVVWHDAELGVSEIHGAILDVAGGSRGTSWTGAGISNTSGVSTYPALANGAQGPTVVAWQDDTSGHDEVYVAALAPPLGPWVELGSGSASGGGISQTGMDSGPPTVAVSAGGRVLVAWSEPTAAGRDVWAREWDGVAWRELGGSATGGGVSGTGGVVAAPAAAFDGELGLLVWTDDSSENLEVYARRFDGSVWRELGATAASAGGISNSHARSTNPSVVAGAGRICAAWDEAADPDDEIVLRCTAGQ